MAVPAAVLVPLFLLIPTLGEYIHAKQGAQRAARAAAWEGTGRDYQWAELQAPPRGRQPSGDAADRGRPLREGQPQEKFMTPAVSHRSAVPWLLAALLVLGAAPSSAAVSPVGIGAFGAGSLLIDFNAPGLTDGQEVNGLSTGGLGFSFSLGNGLISLSVVPGPTSNTTPLNIVSDIGISNAGVLTVTLPELSSLFGFGYAMLASNVVPASVTVTLFNGASNVGALSFTALPDPLVPPFFGGFAGLQSTLPFNRTELRFSGAQAWAADDFRVTAVPEPAQWALLLVGVAILGGLAQRRSGRT